MGYDPFAGLEHDLGDGAPLIDDEADDLGDVRRDDRETFPCQSCAGTGKFRGIRRHQEKAHCFACGGRGFFYTSAADRYRKRQQAKARNLRIAEESVTAVDESLLPFLRKAGEWSSFAADLANRVASGKALSEKQVAAAQRMKAKCEARAAERAKERAKNTVAVDLSPIKEMFENARESGYKRPSYRAEGLVLSLAGEHSRNAGALYVKSAESDEYLGKIIEGVFLPARGGTAAASAGLKEIAADPRGAAIRYGQRTGNCSCCGRTLTNHTSIEAGIGPICASKWGL